MDLTFLVYLYCIYKMIIGKRNITRERIDRYFLNVERVSSEYKILVYDLFEIIDYQETKRKNKGKEGNLEKSLEVVERWLSWKGNIKKVCKT